MEKCENKKELQEVCQRNAKCHLHGDNFSTYIIKVPKRTFLTTVHLWQFTFKSGKKLTAQVPCVTSRRRIFKTPETHRHTDSTSAGVVSFTFTYLLFKHQVRY